MTLMLWLLNVRTYRLLSYSSLQEEAGGIEECLKRKRKNETEQLWKT